MNRRSHQSIDSHSAEVFPRGISGGIIDGLPRRTVLAAGWAMGISSVLAGFANAAEPVPNQQSLSTPSTGVDQNAAHTPSLNGLENGDHSVQVNGVDLAFRIRGAGPVLFIVSPGWGTGSAYLQKGFAFLESRFRLVFIDTRGSGRSSRPVDAGKMGSSDMADDLEALRNYLGLPTVQIIGHSNSGAIVLYYAERYPDRASKVVLISSQVIGLEWIKTTREILRQRADDPRYSEAVRNATDYFDGKIDPAKSDEEFTAFWGRILPLYLERPELNLPRAREDLAGVISSWAFRAQNAADAAAHIDQVAPLGRVKAERLHADIAKSRFVVFEQSGHLPWMEEGDKFMRELTQFL
jgi:proline iminopeptidase